MFNLFFSYRQIKKLIKIFRNLRETLVVIGFLVMVIFTFIAVLFRYLPGLMPIFWSEELLRYTFVWLVFLSFSIAVEKKELLGIDIIINRFSFRTRNILTMACNIISIIFLAFLFFYGIRMVNVNMAQRASSLPIRLSIVYLAVPTGAFISIIGLISHLTENLSKFLNKNSK